MARGDPVRVLLVEDNPGDVVLTRELLAHAAPGAYELTAASTLADAGAAEPDARLALLDLGLPDSQGLATFLHLRARRPNLPIVILSGLHDEQVAVDAIRCGAQDYIVKGRFDAPQLAWTLHHALQRAEFVEVLERALRPHRLSRGSCRSLVTGAPDAIAVLDPQGRELFADARVAELLGGPPGEVLRELVGSGADTPHELRVPGPGGLRRNVEARGSEVRWGDAGARLFCLFDVTEWTTVSEALGGGTGKLRLPERAGDARVLRDELGNLLSVIQGYAGVLLDDLSRDDDAYPQVQGLLRAVRRAQAIVGPTSAAAARREQSATESSPVAELVAASVGAAGRDLPEGVELVTDFRADALRATAPAPVVSEVVSALVRAGLAALCGPGTIGIAAEAWGEDGPEAASGPSRVAITLSAVRRGGDAEPGSAPYDGDAPVEAALVELHRLARLAGAAVAVNHRRGRALTVRLLLPAAPADDARPEPVTEAEAERPTVLVLESSEPMRALIVHVLAGSGFEVLAAEDAAAARRLCERHQGSIESVLLDVELPGVAAPDLVDLLARLQPRIRPLYMWCSVDDRRLVRRLEQQGAAMLEKPFRPDELVEGLRALLG